MYPIKADREVLRGLAERVAQIAALPIQQERAELVKAVNELRPIRPLVLAFPEGGWYELLPEAELLCSDPFTREWEMDLRKRLFVHEEIGSDNPIMPNFNVMPAYVFGDYGVKVKWDRPDSPGGSSTWEPPIKTADDVKKLHKKTVSVDHELTSRRVGWAKEMFGDLLNVRVRGTPYWTMGLTQDLIFLRGLDQIMMDVYDNPQLLHDMMAFLRDARMAELDTLEREGQLYLNNEPEDYAGSGGLGYTSELPQKDFAGKVRTQDLWALAESQEFVGIGPEQFNEFALQYHAPVINRFGLACYGCCEPLHAKLDMVKKAIPRLRRVSVSPWYDIHKAAEGLQDKYVYSWKANPALICSPNPDWSLTEKATREMLQATRGCCVEMIMKDTHTFHHDKTRIRRWAQIALKLAKESAG